MIDSMLQDSIDRTLDDRQARPVSPPRVENGFSIWRATTALPRGVAAGATESLAFGSDVLGAFGEVQAGYGAQVDPTLLFSPEAQAARRDAGAAARESVQSGAAFSTEMGTGLRATARDMVPDPATSSTVESILFGLGQFGSKAIGYSVMAGPVAGAVLTGADQAMAASDRLEAEGVDADTRLRAAALEGVASAAGVALPVAGRTLAQTAALVVAGGPGAFVAQQAATRAILENAGYDKIADQYDPFDPVGLAVSTLVPAGFGALAMRGVRRAAPAAVDPAAARALVDMGMSERQALRYDDPRLDAYAVTAAQREGIPPEALLAIKNAGERSRSSAATSPVGAKGIMQFMDETWRAYGKGDVRDPVANIDGAARYMRALIDQYDGDVRAAIAHYNGGGKAGAAVRAGKAPPAAETRAYLDRADRYMAERTGEAAGRAAANDPEAVAAARVQMVRETVESWNLKDPTDIAAAQDHLAAFVRASDQLGAGERVDVTGTINWDTLQNARMLDDMIGRLETARADLLPDAGMTADPGAIRSMRDELANLRRSMPDTSAEALRARAKEIQQEGAGRVSFKKAEAAARREIEATVAETNARIEALERQIETNRGAEQARQQVQEIDRQIAGVRQARAALDAPPSAPRATALAARQAVQGPGRPAAEARQSDAQGTTAGTSTTTAETIAQQGIPVDQQQPSPGSSTGAQRAAAAVDAQAAEIARLSPDMMVQLDGMDAPVRLADALEMVRREAEAEAADAPLLQVAAECFLRSA